MTTTHHGRAIVVMEPGAEPELVEVGLPAVGADDVRVEIRSAGVCHSDLSMLDGTITPTFPVVLGHEASGVVAEVGAGVSDLELGTRVVLNWAPPCRLCTSCLRGEPWLCRRVEGMIRRPGGTLENGTAVNLSLGVGAFAEQTVVPRNAVVPVPTDVDDDIAAIMGCAVLTGVGAVRNTARVRSGESVAVLGLGGIGLSAVAGAAMAGAARVIAVDVSPEKFEAARALGATDAVEWVDRLPNVIRHLTDGLGVDHAFECVGKSATIRAAWSSTRRGGTCTVVGVGRATDEVSFNAMEIYHFGRTLQGSVFGSSDPERDVPVLVDLVRTGRLHLEPLITHRGGMTDIGNAFDRMRRGEGVRSIIHPHDERL